MSFKVVVWGPGNVGAPALRTVVRHPELELAGVIVHDESKNGRDAGELVGLPPIGVQATTDVEEVFATEPDALVYAVNQDFRPLEARGEMLHALRSGINVVTAGTYGLLHPATGDSALVESFEAACEEGQSSFLVSGIDPGFAMDLLPVVLSGLVEEIREIRIIENFNYETYHDAVPDSVKAIMGFGSSMDQTPAMILPGVPSSVWGGAIQALGDALELEVSEVREVIERHPLERDVELTGGRFEKGTQGAFRFEVQGIVGGRPVLVVEHITRIVDDTAPQWQSANGMGFHQVSLTGRPSIKLTLECEDEHGDHAAGGNAAAAARIVNAIPRVCRGPWGILSAIDLPLIAGLGRVRA